MADRFKTFPRTRGIGSRDEILYFEQMGFATWPALEVECFEGWELRFADGFTGRSNSVQVLDSTPGEPAELIARIAHCERRYRERGLSPRFKLTAAAQPEELDRLLAERGYLRLAPTRVQTIGLGDGLCSPDPTVRVETRLDPAWIEVTTRLNGLTQSAASTWRAIVERIERPLFASIGVGVDSEAVGLGVLYQGWLFMGAIATALPARGRGNATALVGTLLARAQQSGAQGGWLQVTEDNPGGLALYERLGFQDVYGYWYRALAP